MLASGAVMAPAQAIVRADAPTYRTSITAHASANTKGSYTEISAAATRDVSGFYIYAVNALALGDYLADVAIGAAASELDIAANVPFSFSNNNDNQVRYFPLHIRAGSRIAMRIQATTGGTTLQVGVYLVTSVMPHGFQRSVTAGATTADSGGIAVDAGAVGDTKGSYSEITSSLTAAVRSITGCIGGRTNAAKAEGSFSYDFAIGAGGSEQIVIPDVHIYSDSGAVAFFPPVTEWPIDIPTATRCAVRAKSSITDATDRVFDFSFVGFS